MMARSPSGVVLAYALPLAGCVLAALYAFRYALPRPFGRPSVDLAAA